MKTPTLVLAISLAALSVPAPARAEGEAAFAPAATGFGEVGQLALTLGATADEPFLFHKSGDSWRLQLEPSADYFLAPHISLGGTFTYAHGSSGGPNSQGTDFFRVAPRAGYAFTFSDRLGLWPLGGIAIDHASGPNHSSDTNTWLTIFVPVLFHVAPHFFVGAGPSFQAHLSGQGGSTWGIDSMIGGWF